MSVEREGAMGVLERNYDERRPRRGGWFDGRGPRRMNTWLIVANVAVFVAALFLGGSDINRNPFFVHGHFSTYHFLRLEVWRLVTFQFLHADVMHIAMNMFGLWVFGPIVESQLGGRKYLAFYLVCGIAGGLMYLLLNLLGFLAGSAGVAHVPALLYGSAKTPLVGASAGVFGMIMASAFIRPNDRMQVLFLPFELKLKQVAYGYVAVAVISLVFGSKNQGGEAAHVGGAVAGFFFVRNSHLLRDFFDVFKDSRKAAGSVVSRGGIARGGGREISDAEIDRILAKVRAEGMASLTAAEKKTLHDRTEQDRRRATGS